MLELVFGVLVMNCVADIAFKLLASASSAGCALEAGATFDGREVQLSYTPRLKAEHTFFILDSH